VLTRSLSAKHFFLVGKVVADNGVSLALLPSAFSTGYTRYTPHTLPHPLHSMYALHALARGVMGGKQDGDKDDRGEERGEDEDDAAYGRTRMTQHIPAACLVQGRGCQGVRTCAGARGGKRRPTVAAASCNTCLSVRVRGEGEVTGEERGGKGGQERGSLTAAARRWQGSTSTKSCGCPTSTRSPASTWPTPALPSRFPARPPPPCALSPPCPGCVCASRAVACPPSPTPSPTDPMPAGPRTAGRPGTRHLARGMACWLACALAYHMPYSPCTHALLP